MTAPAWLVGDVLWGIATALMLVASILLMGSLVRNPALPGAAKQAATAEARGVYGITRHPMLWSFAIWGGSHILVLPIAKNIVLSGAIIFLSLVGANFQDRKKAQLDPQGWSAWQNRTSYLPFAAIVQGRARFGGFGLHAILRRYRRLAGGDVGAHAAGGMARRHLALGGVGSLGSRLLSTKLAERKEERSRLDLPSRRYEHATGVGKRDQGGEWRQMGRHTFA